MMTCYDIVSKFHKKRETLPKPVFIFLDPAGRVCGEYMPYLESDVWSGDDWESVRNREIAYWSVGWDQQDVDVVQFLITMR